MAHIASGTSDGLFRWGQGRAGDGGGHGRQSVGPSLAGKNPGQRCSGRAQTPASVGQGGALHQSGELSSIQACAVCLPNGPSLDDDLRRCASPDRGWFRARSIGLPSTPGTIPASRVPRVSPSHRKRGTKCHRTSCHQSSEPCRR